MPVLEEGHGQIGRLDATTHQLDELRKVVVAQNAQLDGAARDPKRERREDVLQAEHLYSTSCEAVSHHGSTSAAMIHR